MVGPLIRNFPIHVQFDKLLRLHRESRSARLPHLNQKLPFCFKIKITIPAGAVNLLQNERELELVMFKFIFHVVRHFQVRVQGNFKSDTDTNKKKTDR